MPLRNQAINVSFNPSPTPMPMSTQESQNLFVLSPSCTPSQPPPNQVTTDEMVNLGESNEMGPWDDGNERSELVDDPFEDDVDVVEDACNTLQLFDVNKKI